MTGASLVQLTVEVSWPSDVVLFIYYMTADVPTACRLLCWPLSAVVLAIVNEAQTL